MLPYATTTNQTLFIDGQYYQGIHFISCTLVYQGGPVPNFQECRFSDCQWQCDGPALNTLDFLNMLVSLGGADIVKRSLGLADPPPPPEARNG